MVMADRHDRPRGDPGETMKKPSLLLPFALGHFANDCAPCSIWLIAPAVAVAMDLSPMEVGLLITMQSVGAALGYFPAGLIADHVANRGRLLLATFWWVPQLERVVDLTGRHARRVAFSGPLVQ